METLLYIIFFLSCLILVVAVLLQPGKTDAGALFTSGVSSAALNPRGTQSVLSKITIGAATVFMVSALLLSLPALTGNRSVVQSGGDEPADAANVNANAANANSAPGNAAAVSNTASNSAANPDGNAKETEKTGKDAKESKTDVDSKESGDGGKNE